MSLCGVCASEIAPHQANRPASAHPISTVNVWLSNHLRRPTIDPDDVFVSFRHLRRNRTYCSMMRFKFVTRQGVLNSFFKFYLLLNKHSTIICTSRIMCTYFKSLQRKHDQYICVKNYIGKVDFDDITLFFIFFLIQNANSVNQILKLQSYVLIY